MQACGRRLQIEEHRRTKEGEDTTYYRCVNKCADAGQQAPVKSRTWLPESQEELLPIVEREVIAAGGHDRQNRGDIINEVAVLLWMKAWTMEDLKDRKKLRAFITNFNEQYASKYNNRGSSKSLDQPVRDGDPDSATLLAFQTTPDASPHELLEAKEAVTARLNGGGAEFVASVVEEAREAGRGVNG